MTEPYASHDASEIEPKLSNPEDKGYQKDWPSSLLNKT
jgi:hypothetical protein